MNKNEERIKDPPRTLKEAREATLLHSRLTSEVPIMEAKFPLIEELARVQSKYQIDMSPNIRSMVSNLRPAWEAYIRKLNEAEEMLFISKEEFKASLMKQADRFKNVVKSFLDDFMVKMPTSSEM